ncbi:hypothetical protein EDD15DRAFT_2194607 [Pisolithus albus]|nr:hypothetical protein EDD15DRAFT_2194607 [Pisolithus albus]
MTRPPPHQSEGGGMHTPDHRVSRPAPTASQGSQIVGKHPHNCNLAWSGPPFQGELREQTTTCGLGDIQVKVSWNPRGSISGNRMRSAVDPKMITSQFRNALHAGVFTCHVSVGSSIELGWGVGVGYMITPCKCGDTVYLSPSRTTPVVAVLHLGVQTVIYVSTDKHDIGHFILWTNIDGSTAPRHSNEHVDGICAVIVMLVLIEGNCESGHSYADVRGVDVCSEGEHPLHGVQTISFSPVAVDLHGACSSHLAEHIHQY